LQKIRGALSAVGGSLMVMSHVDVLRSTTTLVREHGAAAALDHLRRTRPALHAGEYHHTRAAFLVWAVERLVASELTDVAVLWHPLTDRRSVEAWYDAATLASPAARDGFVPATLALAGEPVPAEPRTLVAA
jgi:hypothetical protein